MIGDGGTDGAGAVGTILALPLDFDYPSANVVAGMTGTFEIRNVTDTAVIGQPYAVGGTSKAYINIRWVDPGTAVSAVQNGDFAHGDRAFDGTLTYYARRS